MTNASTSVNGQPSDVHGPLDGVGTQPLGTLAQRGAEVDRDAGDEGHGQRAGTRHHDGADDAPRPLRQRMVEDGYG